MNKNILLACRDAVIGYDNTVAVNGVSFELERGDYLCIVGENGSGKSTLLRCLNRTSKRYSGAYPDERRKR